MAAVFISYRRDDCAAHAGRLYDRLAQRTGEDAVFMDVDAIEPGVDFGARIEEAIGACRVVIVLIGDDWLDITDERGRRRLDDPTDLVRQEVAAALRRPDVRVVPVLVEEARMPPAERLPDDLKALARRNALELSDAGWRYDVERLIEVVERVLSPNGGSSPVTTEPLPEGAQETNPSQPRANQHADQDAVAAKSGGDGRSPARRAGALAAGAGVLVAAALGAILLTPDDEPRPDTPDARTEPTRSVDARAEADVPIPIASRPNGITFANGRVWVLSGGSGEIVVLDAQDSRLASRPNIGRGGTAIAAGFNSIWAIKENTRSLIRLSRTGDRKGATQIRAPGKPVAVVTGARAVWVGIRNGVDGTLVRIDPQDPARQQTTVIRGGVQEVAVGSGAVWVTTTSRNRVVRVDVDVLANKKEIRVGEKPRGVAVGQGAVWVANSGDRTITRIDLRNHEPAESISLEFTPTRVATGGGAVWVTAQDANRLIRIDPRRLEVREQVTTGRQPYALDVVRGDAVWVTLVLGNSVQRVRFHP